jgi:hypothetical protein
MKNETNVSPYPHLHTRLVYREAADKLAYFKKQRELEREKLAQLQIEYAQQFDMMHLGQRTEESVIEKAEALIGGSAPQQSVTERIDTTTRLIAALGVAIDAQAKIVNRVEGEFSREAGQDHVAEHKAIVRRIIAAAQELHEANKRESDFRWNLEKLGYFGALRPMGLAGVDDPADRNGNRTHYWMKEVEEYLMTPKERAAVVAAAAEAEDKLAAINREIAEHRNRPIWAR